ncbi:uncharacterized protein [Euphorbia lathyris]|uniref:uncharacterized protein isoform X2 n=1 Tax=Euphorbia lathyris TaxID=212925 RepID=UPI0033143778
MSHWFSVQPVEPTERPTIEGKSVLLSARRLDMDEEEDTPRHMRLRGIDISAHRRRGAATEQVRRGPIVDQPDIRRAEAETDYDDRDRDSDSVDDYLEVVAQGEDGDEQPTQGRQLIQRRGGCFASTGTSKRPKTSED